MYFRPESWVAMSALPRCLPYILLAGQLLIFFQIEQREMQAVMLAFLAFQIWKKFKTNLADLSESWQIVIWRKI